LREDAGWSSAWLEFVVHATRQPQTLTQLRELDQRLVRGAALRLASQGGLSKPDSEYLTTVSLLTGSGLMVERLLAPDAAPEAQIERLARALARDLDEGVKR
jgi:hypothetical protein